MSQATKLMIAMVCIAAAAATFTASGLSGYSGLQPQTGIQDDVEESQKEFRSYSATRQEGEVNFIGSVFSSAGKVMDGFRLLFQLPELAMNSGLPGWAAEFLAAPVVFLFGLFFVYLLSGRRTTSRI